jgi:thiamine-monophosphate kinase
MDEFGLIARYFRPLAAPGALDLADDAATLSLATGEELVLTKDAIVAGIHFLATDPLDYVARKLLRANLSDLAAKGARPAGYLLACCWPKGTTEDSIALFARGLAHDQDVYGIKLLGGDTTATDGPLTLSLTALGIVPHGKMVHRSSARAGDKVFVTGTIGDAGLGLKVAHGEAIGTSEASAYLLQRYRLPEPRLAFGMAARGCLLSAIDVSDGLIADAGHIAKTSGVSIILEAAKLPLSAAAKGWLSRGGSPAFLATCGDDYEICFTASPRAEADLQRLATKTNTQVTEIGRVDTGQGVRFVAADGAEIPVQTAGFRHF